MKFDLQNWQVSSSRKLFEGLDGIRGIAILLVIASHTIPSVYMDTPLKRYLCVLCTNGPLGVFMFFVLSGFLISAPLFKRLRAGESPMPPGYILRRASKIFPPLYLSVVILTMWLAWTSQDWTYLKGGLETMAFFQIFQTPHPLITPIYWSLAAEVTFYTTLPLLCLICRRKPELIPVLLIAVSATVWISLAGHVEVRSTFPFFRDVLSSFVFFGWGTIFSLLRLSLPDRPIGLSGFYVGAGLIGIALCCCVQTHYWLLYKQPMEGTFSRLLFTNAVGFFSFLLLFVTYDVGSWSARFLSWTPLVIAGVISYEWYLFHLLFIWMSDQITGNDLHGSYAKLMIRMVFAFPLSFIFSALVYRLLSLPILRWAHHSRSGNRTSASLAVRNTA